MILVDSRIGSKELLPFIRRAGVLCELGSLEFGDAAFEGNGPSGKIMVGVERKRLHDMLNCIDDHRYTGHQKIGMARMYAKSFLVVEGSWMPSNPDGWLLEGFNGGSWVPCRYRSRRTIYSKLYRYLLSVQLSGVIITYSRDIWHTAYNICEIFHYFQKRWENHTSLLETQKLQIPDMNAKPSLTRRWAAEIEDVGVKLSQEAESLFGSPLSLAESTEADWMSIKGIGKKTAQKIVKEIRGKRS